MTKLIVYRKATDTQMIPAHRYKYVINEGTQMHTRHIDRNYNSEEMQLGVCVPLCVHVFLHVGMNQFCLVSEG